MTLAELRAKWAKRAAEWRALGVTITGEKIAVELLADLDSVSPPDEEAVSLKEAALMSGYSPDHLGRLVKAGQLTNRGTKARPKVLVADLPRKPAAAKLNRAQAVAAVITQHSR
jgi:hypothetical protein